MKLLHSLLFATVACHTSTTRSTAFVWPNSHSSPRSSISTKLYESALIVQNKGGGHGELGFQLALLLKDHPKISEISILQDDACKDEQEPFCSYNTEGMRGITVMKAPLSESADAIEQMQMQGMLGGRDAKFDYIWDNFSKSPDTGVTKSLLSCAKAWGSQLYVYVSSAGMYQPTSSTTFPMDEDSTPVKESAGQYLMDQCAKEEMGLPYVSFRPQYIYGENANKHDYIDYFMDRLVRALPIPIPGDGTQLVSLTNSKDVVSLLASPLNNIEAAKQQCYFNCGTDQLVSYNDVAYLCAEAAGIAKEQVKLEHYEADLFGKTSFPFRPTNFYVAPDKAKAVLGWPGAQHSLKEDLKWYYENYKIRGGPEKKMSLVKDWEIVVGSKTQPPEYMESVYDKYDPLVVDLSQLESNSQ